MPKAQGLGCNDDVDVESFSVGCWSALLPGFGPQFGGESQRIIREWEVAARLRVYELVKASYPQRLLCTKEFSF